MGIDGGAALSQQRKIPVMAVLVSGDKGLAACFDGYASGVSALGSNVLRQKIAGGELAKSKGR
jgi:hypothetical protein